MHEDADWSMLFIALKFESEILLQKMHDNTHFVINHVTRHHFYTNILFKQQND